MKEKAEEYVKTEEELTANNQEISTFTLPSLHLWLLCCNVFFYTQATVPHMSKWWL